MKIELHEITVGEIYNGYADSGENGVVGYGGKLNIRPKYQREFVYDDKKRNAVIDTINRGFPLNVMYWAVNEDGTYEILDGQQRTVSFCRYVHGDFSIDNRYFHNLTQTGNWQIQTKRVPRFWQSLRSKAVRRRTGPAAFPFYYTQPRRRTQVRRARFDKAGRGCYAVISARNRRRNRT